MAATAKPRGAGEGSIVRAGALATLVVAFASALLGRSTSRPGAANRVGLRDQARAPHRRAKARPGGIKGKLWDLGQRVRPLGVALDVQQRYSELNGNNLAAAVTLQAFLAMFPLLIVVVAVVGFVSAGGTDVAGDIVERFGLTGTARDTFTDAIDTARDSRRAASVIGLLGLAWAGLGLVSALQYGYDQVWQVQARGVKDKAVGLVWFAGFFVVALSSGALSTVLRFLPEVLAPVGVLVGLAMNFAVFLWTAKILPNRDVGWRPLIPGAVFAAIGFEILKFVAAYWVPRTIANSSELYGSIGVVLAVIAFLLLLGKLLIYSATLNVVLYEARCGTYEVRLEVPATPGVLDSDADRTGQTSVIDKDDRAAKPGHRAG